jgi:tRNA uridine 5-carboxymethylaminomethyl modification enzyme
MKNNTDIYLDKFDIIVVGGGHAGIEAALSSARLGKKTLMVCMTLESIALMPCNPSIGGTGKGQLVREIDALGGQMGLTIDKTMIQAKMLNATKGAAVHSPRAQADKNAYQVEMKRVLESETNLTLRQGEVVEILTDEKKERVAGVRLRTNTRYKAKVVILATGTYLNALVHVSDVEYNSGPNGLSASMALANSLNSLNISLRRFKTGTPARALSSSIDFYKTIPQKGDEIITPFSFLTDEIDIEQVDCYLTYTTPRTQKIVAENIHKSAPYGGLTTGVGPRYCLSIEDKVSRFPDRERHQVFLEPEGKSTEEVYIQGMSTSTPEDVQEQFYRTIIGLENAKFTRYGYSIEYDCIDSLMLKPTLEYKDINGLFFAGQICGTSGYEEAAAQGLIAGINAVLAIDKKPEFVLGRDEAYIGVLIDDLTTKGTNEPYRMMTSRAEYRLIIRQDNADQRLTRRGYELGLASDTRLKKLEEYEKQLGEAFDYANKTKLDVSQILTDELEETGKVYQKKIIADILKNPKIKIQDLTNIDAYLANLPARVLEQMEISIKYEGYIKKQEIAIERFKRLEEKPIPGDINYEEIDSLRLEAREKLSKIRPTSIGRASRISGVSPADINVLLVYIQKKYRG